MKLRLSELRRLIREMAMMQPASSAALMIHKIWSGHVFVLYDGDSIDVSAGDVNPTTDVVLATIEVDDDGQVHSSAAVKGYGPFIYDVAMQETPGGIYPDPSEGGPSPSALAIWQFYESKRTDVVKEPEPKSPTGVRFKVVDGKKIHDISRLISRHDEIEEKRREAGDARFCHRLWGAAHSFFRARYKSSN